jgi:hypothetical protein
MADEAHLPQLYTMKTLVTLGGASAAVVLVSGAASHAFNFNPKWLALVVAEIIAFVGLLRLPRTQKRDAALIVVTLLNGALIYSDAVGLNALNHSSAPAQVQKAAIIPFVDPEPWWPAAELVQEVKRGEASASRALQSFAGIEAELQSLDAFASNLEGYVSSRRAALDAESQATAKQLEEAGRALEHAPAAERAGLQKRTNELRLSYAQSTKRLEGARELERVMAYAQQIDSKGEVGMLADLRAGISRAKAALAESRAALKPGS